MRRPRVKVSGSACYHVVSRIGGRRFLLDDGEKARLLDFVRRAAGFSGVELLSYAVMSNHFHLLVRIPKRKDVPDAELMKRLLVLYGKAKFAKVQEKWDGWAKRHQESRVEEEKDRMRDRMYDLSQFCKTFKEAYSQDYNRRHDNTGTIWEGRFKSILVEQFYRALLTVAGYIHLNPVRAGIVKSADESPWTSYGAACRGNESARSELCRLVALAYAAQDVSWNRALHVLGAALHGEIASSPEKIDMVEDMSKEPVSTEPISDDDAPPFSLREMLRCRVADFLHGDALGSPRFVDSVVEAWPSRKRRKARSMVDACPFAGLATARGVRSSPALPKSESNPLGSDGAAM